MSDIERLRQEVERQAKRMRQAERDRPILLAHTVYLTTLGLLFVTPVVGSAYLGQWLDSQTPGYSVRWTIGCLLLGVAVGAVNVYLFIRGHSR